MIWSVLEVRWVEWVVVRVVVVVRDGFTFVQAITFMTMQSNPCYDGKNHKNDNLDQFESTAR